MTKAEAQIAIKNLNAQLLDINPTSIITFFEIDIGDLAFERGIFVPDNERIFRFHNTVNLTTNSLFFGYENGNEIEYTAAPITAEGFEINIRGTLPTPKLSMTVSPEGIDKLALLKQQIRQFGDLAGAKVTRIRTFLKFLNPSNFPNNENADANHNAIFSKDIFFIDRKSKENKYVLEFELATVFDIQDLQLPSRTILATKCVWQYRGEGCLYESEDRRNEKIHKDGILAPSSDEVPPIANEKNEPIKKIINPSNPYSIRFNDRGLWQKNIIYNGSGFVHDYVYIERNGYKYYFVAKINVPVNISPPNAYYWIADMCAKDLTGCKLRWAGRAFDRINYNVLPFGAFASANRFGQ